MYREDARRGLAARGLLGAQIGGGKAGVPIVAVDDVGAPIGGGAGAERRSDPAQQGQTAMVSGPPAAVGSAIRAAGPIVERRMVDEIGSNLATRQCRQRDAHAL